MTEMLDANYRVRHALLDDASEMQALIAASDVHEFGESDGYSLDEVLDDWKRLDLERDVWVAVAPDGAIAGYGYIWSRQHVRNDIEVYVHPSHFGRGIGSTLVRLAEERAREHVPLAPPEARVVVNNWINALNAEARALLEREGYEPGRYFWRMESALDENLEPPQWQEGVSVHTAAVDGDLRPFYTTVEEGMADHWGHVTLPFEEWAERRTGSTFDPNLWFLAMESDEPAGAVLCSLSDDIGWVETLAVRRNYRRRGIGLALLKHAFGELARRGAQRARLSVDAASPTGATRLYERAGMHVAQEHAAYSKVLRAGHMSDGLDEMED